MFTVYRFQKKKLGELKNAQRHNLREQETPNADPEKLALNHHIGGTDFEKAVKDRCRQAGVKITDKRVAAVEHLVTASPEFFANKSGDEIAEWANHALAYFRKKYGAENIVAIDYHRDEKTPHLHIIHVPITTLKGVKVKSETTGKMVSEFVDSGKLRLNADALIGGSKANAAKLQDEFAEHMQSKYPELARGISKKNREATYDRVQDWYSNVEKSGQKRIEKILNRFQQIQNTAGSGILGKIKKLDVINQTKEKADRFDQMSEFITDELRPELESVFEQLKVLQDDNKRLKFNESQSAGRIRELEQAEVMKKIEALEAQVDELTEKNEQYQMTAHRAEIQLQNSEKKVTELKSENRSLSERLEAMTAEANKRLNESIERAVERTKSEMNDQMRRAVTDAVAETEQSMQAEIAGLERDYGTLFNRLVMIEKRRPGEVNRGSRTIDLRAYARSEEQQRYANSIPHSMSNKQSGPTFR